FLRNKGFTEAVTEAGTGWLPPYILVPVMEKARQLRARGKGEEDMPSRRFATQELTDLIGVSRALLAGWEKFWELVGSPLEAIEEALTAWRGQGSELTWL